MQKYKIFMENTYFCIVKIPVAELFWVEWR